NYFLSYTIYGTKNHYQNLLMRGGKRELEGEGRKLRVSKRKPQVFSRDVNSLPLLRKRKLE
ncbi:hypothetical protein, partial [Peptoniphilus duerdenii]|uniref:hypothetical protein n=1 Tax=Peptoniphilus duerdenii TaxID=507750 RepID=UPI00288A8A59